MNYAKKMVLVPEHTLERLQKRQNVSTPPLTARLNGLDHDIQDVLDDNQLTKDEKVRQYSQALQNYLTYYNQRKDQPINVKIQPPKKKSNEDTAQEAQSEQESTEPLPPSIEREIIQALPRTLKDRGKMLLEKIKENPDVMKWDERGQLVFEGKPLKGSHIIDLIKDSLRTSKKSTPPLGYDWFTRGLAKMNAPDHLVVNKQRKSTLRNLKTGVQPPLSQGPEQEERNEWFPTPSIPGPVRNVRRKTRQEIRQRWLTFRH